MRTLFLEYDEKTDSIRCRFPSSKRFVKFMQQLPSRKCSWIPSKKAWVIKPSLLKTLCKGALSFFDNIEYKGLPNEHQYIIADLKAENRSAKEQTPYDTLFVLEGAPMEVVKGAYKALARKFHPDTGAKEEQFLEIDTAYRQICQERL